MLSNDELDDVGEVIGPLDEFAEGESDKLDSTPPHPHTHAHTETHDLTASVNMEDIPLVDEHGAEIVFGDPLTMEDATSLDCVVQRRLQQLHSSDREDKGKAKVNYREKQRQMLDSLQRSLHFAEDEQALLGVERVLEEKRLAEELAMKALLSPTAAEEKKKKPRKSRVGSYEDEEDDDEEEEAVEEEEPQAEEEQDDDDEDEDEEEDDDVNFRRRKTYTPKKAANNNATASTATVTAAIDNNNNSNAVAATPAKPTTTATAAAPAKMRWVDCSLLKRSLFEELRPRLAVQHPFELDDFQKQAVLRLERREHVFVAAHTSAGKTVVAEYAIALALKNNSRCVYTSPIKALSNQKYRDFKERFGVENVGIVTGDVSVNPNAQCLIMTTEIFRSMLYKGADTVQNIEFVVFDEVHYVNDSERGVVWEEVIIMLPESITLIFLSATTPNAQEFGEWIGRTKRKKVYLTSTDKRPVPLQHYLFFDNDAYKLMDGDKAYKPQALHEAKRCSDEKLKPKAQSVENIKMAAQREGEKAAEKAKREGKSPGQQQIKEAVTKKTYEEKMALNKKPPPNKAGGSFAGSGSGGAAGGSRAEWLALINILQDGGREEKGRLKAIDFGVATAQHVTLDKDVKKEKEKLFTPYEKLPAEMREKMTKHEYEKQSADVRVDKDGGEEDEEAVETGLLPVVVFSFSKKKCESIADCFKGKNFLSNREKGKVQMLLKTVLSKLSPVDAELPQITRLCDMLSRGIGVHHSGLLPILKETVEILFAQSAVKILFATETFAMGVNMPAKAVVFNGFRKHDGKSFRDLTPGEYIQMAGRAGRRGLDKVGTVVIASFQELPKELDVKNLLTGRPLVLASQFRLRYNMILNLVRVQNLSVQEMIKSSFTEFASQKMLANHDLSVKKRRYEDMLAYLQSERDQLLSALPHSDKESVSAAVQRLQELHEVMLLVQNFATQQWRHLNAHVKLQEKTVATSNNSIDFGGLPVKSAKSGKKKAGTGASSAPTATNTNKHWAEKVFPAGRVLLANVPILQSPTLCVVLRDPLQTRAILAEREKEAERAKKEAEERERKSMTASQKLAVGGLGGAMSDAARARAQMLGLAPASPAPVSVSAASSAASSAAAETKVVTLKDPIENNTVFVLVAVNPAELSPTVADALSSLSPSATETAKDTLVLEEKQAREEYGATSLGMHFLVTRIALKDVALYLSASLALSNSETPTVDLNAVLSELQLLRLTDPQEFASQHSTLCVDLPSEFQLTTKEHFDFVDRQKTIEHSYAAPLLRTVSEQLVSHTQSSLYANIAQCDHMSRKLYMIKRALSDESMSLFPDFQKRIALLGQLGYLDESCAVITHKGRVSCELNSCDELLGCEMLFHNVLDPLSPAEAVAILSALVFQEKNKNDDESLQTVPMEVAKSELKKIFYNLNTLQNIDEIENETEPSSILNFGLCSVVYEWATGTSFKDIMKNTDFAEGSIVRSITRLDELCRDVQKAAVVMGNPALFRKMAVASTLIKRDIVFAASLYIQ